MRRTSHVFWLAYFPPPSPFQDVNKLKVLWNANRELVAVKPEVN